MFRVLGLTSVFLTSALGLCGSAQAQPTSLDQGFRALYNLDFATAHRAFEDHETADPHDPVGPACDAAAYLFTEFDRLHILQTELFTDNDRFLALRRATPDPATKRSFEQALERSERLSASALAKSPDDADALFATVLRHGLHGDYLSLIDKQNWAALAEVKQGRVAAEKLLAQHPDYYDAYLAVGVENYMLSLKPAPIRWFLRAGGAQTDKDMGLAKLRITAEHGRYFLPYARLLLAIAALRDKDPGTAKLLLSWLAAEFPQNEMYRTELAKLN